MSILDSWSVHEMSPGRSSGKVSAVDNGKRSGTKGRK